MCTSTSAGTSRSPKLSKSNTSISAAQQLLEIKQKEYSRKQYEMQQEQLIQSKAQQRKEEYMKRASTDADENVNANNIDSGNVTGSTSRAANNANAMFYNALLSMHSNNDLSTCTSSNSNNSNNSKKSKAQKQLLNGRKTNRIRKSGVVKKGRQSKHYKR
jgi:hypothetical protein